jgi:signal transduction histidine kinase
MIKTPANANRLLTRQLKKFFADGNCTIDTFNQFIESVSDAYHASEEERALYKRAEQISSAELEKTNVALQIKNDFLDTFNHGMAHDIKNHTSNIIGLINMLKKYTAKQNMEMVHEINDQLELSANQMTSIVQGFLYLSRSEVKVDNQYIVISKEALINVINLETKFLGLGKNVTINYEFNLNELFFSRHILKIIFVNLISNSIKYSKPDVDPIIKATLSHDQNNITLSVSDNGIGIDMEHAEKKLYNLFEQAENNSHKGFGVGLFLIKKIADRNKGQIKVESTLGIGTTVTVQFPTQA